MPEKQIFKKILVPADGSVSSLSAQEIAALIARKLDSKVTVLNVVAHELMHTAMQDYFPGADTDFAAAAVITGEHVIPAQTPNQPSAIVRRKTADEITNWAHEKGEEILDEAVAFFRKKGVEVDQKLLKHVDPANSIINEVEKGKYGLVAMGRSAEKEQIPHLGSIAGKVSRHAKSSVLVSTGGKEQVSKILVPVDGSKNAESAAKHAGVLAKNLDAEISLLYVQESSLFGFRPELTKKIGANILSKTAHLVKGVKTDQKLEQGDPAKVIIQTADKGDYDMIVMGGKGHNAVRNFVMGSVSDHVLHYANRSVLLVK